jgi:hypothetical protein
MLVLSLFMSACWIPENFNAKVALNNDGSYTFTYDGTLTFGLALAASAQGQLTAKDEIEFKKEEATLRKELGFKNVTYNGRGRYKVVVEKCGKPGEQYYFPSREMQFFADRPQQNHTVLVSGVRPKAEDIQQLKQIGAKIAGTLSVSVGSGLKVLKQNAQSQPGIWTPFGSYKWRIDSPDADPVIVVQP